MIRQAIILDKYPGCIVLVKMFAALVRLKERLLDGMILRSLCCKDAR